MSESANRRYHARLAAKTPEELAAFRAKVKEQSRRWYEKNKQRHISRSIAYQRKRRDHFNALSRARRARNPERSKAKDQQNRQKYGDLMRARCRACYRKNKAADNARRTRNRRAASPEAQERRKQRLRDYYQRNKERFINQATKRKRLRDSVTVNEEAIKAWMRAVLQRPFSVCYYCQRTVVTGGIDFDHVMPLSKGGAHALENLCVSCSECNGAKKDRLFNQWPKSGQTFLQL